MKVERIFLTPSGHLAEANARLQLEAERGSWIWHPSKSAGETAILRFVLRFTLREALSTVLHVSADQRFQLRCNNEIMAFGPDRCDLEHWALHSMRVDLPAGEHVLEALVWWLGDPDASTSRTDQTGADLQPKPPMAQMTWRGGFLLYGETEPGLLNTGAAPWKVADLTPAVRLFKQRIPQYIDVGPSFEFALAAWETALEEPAKVVVGPVEENAYGVRRPGWCLHPASLPEQRREAWIGGHIRAVRHGWSEDAFTEAETGQIESWQSLLAGQPREIPAQTELTLIWDFGKYRCGYPLLRVKGREARLEWDWAEALYEAPNSDAVDSQTGKGQRDEVAHKAFLGFGDRWQVDGAARLPFLWWRSGRYVRLRIATGTEPLCIESIGLLETGYPLDRVGDWQSADGEWDNLIPLFENSYRCSGHEQWTDSPYYEQMSYVGDTMMHALSNYAYFGDDRLSRRAIDLFGWSRAASGFVAERYPSAWRQECFTYAMLWPLMLRDYAWWRDDPAFVASHLAGLRALLAETEFLPRNGLLLCRYPGWPWVDWVPEWTDRQGCGPGVREGDSSIVNLYWVRCLQAAADLEAAFGDARLAVRYREQAAEIFAAILERYWDPAAGLLKDSSAAAPFSEHAQVFALLTGLLDDARTAQCLTGLRENRSLVAMTISASFYLLDALYRHGEEQEFHRRLAFWRDLLPQGFTATPEMPEPSRSDAHAWGSHPLWHTFASIAGIRPDAPGFRRVRIAPSPGALGHFQCTSVHPRGVIQVKADFSNGQARVLLPDGICGQFVWQGREHELPPGESILSL